MYFLNSRLIFVSSKYKIGFLFETVFSCSFRVIFVQNVRDVVWSMQNDELRNFVERNHKTEFDGELAYSKQDLS